MKSHHKFQFLDCRHLWKERINLLAVGLRRSYGRFGIGKCTFGWGAFMYLGNGIAATNASYQWKQENPEVFRNHNVR